MKIIGKSFYLINKTTLWLKALSLKSLIKQIQSRSDSDIAKDVYLRKREDCDM